MIQLRRSLLGLLSLLASVGGLSAQTDARTLDGDVKLIIANDLGRNGWHEQKPVARLMGEVADGIGPEAVLALGDTHHYLGIQSVDDPLWMTNYELIYDHPELQVEWCPVLGNHEYRGNTQAVMDYSAVSRRWKMPARYYTKVFEDNGTSVRVVFVDTAPLIGKYREESDKYPDAGKQDVGRQLAWVDSVLSSAKEDWVIVAGHHPMYADTDKDASERSDLQERLDPILKKHGVDMYVAGHIHNFQHFRKPGSDIDYIVNTSGSKARKVKKIDGTVFCAGVEGFSVLTADKNTLRLSFVDKSGNVIHTVERRAR